MSSKSENVRRTKPSPAARLRPFRIVILLGVVALAGSLVFAATWPGFAPKTIVVGGNRVVGRDEIVSRAAISGHINVWLQDPGTFARRIETIPYVEVATVRREPPATIAIWVSERTPFAVAIAGTQRLLIDRELRVLGPASAETPLPVFALRQTSLPSPGSFLRGESEIALRDEYLALSAAHVFPLEMSFDRFGGLVATLRDGVTVLLGEDVDRERKIALIDPILSQAARADRRVESVDLRAPNTPVVIYKR